MVGVRTLGSKFKWYCGWPRQGNGEQSLSRTAVPVNLAHSNSAGQGAIGFLSLVVVLGFFLIQAWLVARKGAVLFVMILLGVVHVELWFLVLVRVFG